MSALAGGKFQSYCYSRSKSHLRYQIYYEPLDLLGETARTASRRHHPFPPESISHFYQCRQFTSSQNVSLPTCF